MNTDFTLDKLPKNVLSKTHVHSAFMASRCIIAAEKFQIFHLLYKKELTLDAICKKTGIKGIRAEFFLTALVSLGLLRKKGNKYTNTALANQYLVDESSIYLSRLYSKELIDEFLAFSVLEEMLTTGKDYESILGIKRKRLGAEIKHDTKAASEFTHMLYYVHVPYADALAENLDLSGYNSLLDVAGGSGVMSLALARKNKHLKACVLDLETVLKTTKKIIKREKLSGRVSTMVGNMFEHIPTGFDVILLCDAPSVDTEILKRIYNSLPTGGLVVVVEDFCTTDYTEPFYKLMWQLCSDKKWLLNHQEVTDTVRKAGFKSIKKMKISKDLWVITGIKR